MKERNSSSIWLMGKLLFVVMVFGLPAMAQKNTLHFYLNQVGFFTGGPKVAIISGVPLAREFFVVNAKSRDTAFKGTLGVETPSTHSPIKTRAADFTAMTREGEYFVVVPGVPPSPPFLVHPHPYRSVGKAVLKGFYFQRSDMILEERFAGPWHRPAGHPDTAVLVHASASSTTRAAGTTISSPGGWYDAGDYNKYIVNSGITMNTLLSAYEDFPKYFDTLNTAIPESGNAVPDLLDEILYNLRWMLTMQDPSDGGVYHKCTNAAFDGVVMPGITLLPRYVVQKSTAATLDLSAVMAQAARVFRKFDKVLPGLSDSCYKAALAAWSWSVAHPAVRYDQAAMNNRFSPPVSTGEYGDAHFDDEWSLAAAELFITTGNKMYFNHLVANTKERIILPSWAQVAAAGHYSMLRHRLKLPSYTVPYLDSLQKRVLQVADSFAARYRATAFRTVMGLSKNDFVWGSNAVAANQAILLLNAFLLTKDRKYMDAALSNADYLLGRNATGYCFVTGIGDRYTRNPHHRPSMADGIVEPVPGLLAGGPNPGRQDKCTYAFTDPETAYTDHDCSYASNEIAINWNAPVVYLFNALEALSGR